MNNLFQKFFLIALVSCVSFLTKAQGFEPGEGFKQVNFGVGVSTRGIPVYAGMDFGVSEHITIGPRISYRRYSDDFRSAFGNFDIDYSIINLSFRGDYHFGGHLEGVPEELDLYGGLSLGYTIWNNDYDGTNDFDGFESSQVYLALQGGARWYFNENWAVNAELSGGSLSGLEIGASYRF